MTTLETVGVIVKDAAAVLGSLSILFTGLSHFPGLPARAAEFFARVGLATAKFSVNKRPPSGPVEPL